MTESKHTPGPWRRGAITQTITAQNGKRLVADCRGNGSQHPATEDECEANARLIAAAPELLDMVKWAMELRGAKMEGDWFMAARAAIAKAEKVS